MFWISHSRIYTFWSMVIGNMHKSFFWLYSKCQITITWKFHCFDIIGCHTMCKIKGGSELSSLTFNTALSGCFFRVFPSYFLYIFLCSSFYLIPRNLHVVFLCKKLQVRHLDTSKTIELYKLQQLRDEQGMEIPIHS